MMTIDWTHFTPGHALAGGALIGVAVAALLLGSGRIAGISGIVGGLFKRTPAKELSWRGAFVLGLLLAPTLYGVYSALPESDIAAGWTQLVAAGLLVGFGSRYGSGCTSGHGVCGISRLSKRSIAATLTFMAAAILTVSVGRHLLG